MLPLCTSSNVITLRLKLLLMFNCGVSDIRMSLPPRQLGAYRAVPASRVRMAVTRNSVITFLCGLAAPVPPPVDETEGGELTVSRESDEHKVSP